MVYDTQIILVFMGFVNQFITGGPTLYKYRYYVAGNYKPHENGLDL